jgi:glucokinase
MYLVVDLGGTKTRIVAFAGLDQTEFVVLGHFPTCQSYEQQIEQINQTVHGAGLNRIDGAGLALGAQLTRDGVSVDASYTMPEYVGRPIVTDLAAVWDCPVRAANDNICAVIAETRLGSLRGIERGASLTISTGTGAGIRLQSGSTALAFLAQVGHHSIDPHGERCTCGQVGCVQTITGGQQILRRYGVPASELNDPVAWQTITDALAQAIVNLVRITRIDALCLSGGIGYNSSYLRDHLPETVRRLGPGIRVDIRYPALGEDAPTLGAALLLRDDLDTVILH